MIAAEDFVPREQAAIVRAKRGTPERGYELDWLSRNITEIETRYAGHWIAVSGDEVIAAAQNLHDLLGQIVGVEKPFITFIPAGRVVWKFTYAHQNL